MNNVQKKENVAALVTDIVILAVTVLVSVVLLVQHSSAKQMIADVREDLYFRPVNPKIDLLFGNPDADLFIVEYGDLECPHCREFHPHIKTFIQSDWGVSGKVAWVWRNGFHINETSIKKGQVLECIRLHGGDRARMTAWKFLEESLLSGVMEIDYPSDRYRVIMERLNISPDRIEECRRDNEVALQILQSIEDVRKLNIIETPYIQFISGNGELLFETVGSLTVSQLEDYVASILRRS